MKNIEVLDEKLTIRELVEFVKEYDINGTNEYPEHRLEGYAFLNELLVDKWPDKQIDLKVVLGYE